MRIGLYLPTTEPARLPEAVEAARGLDAVWTNQNIGGTDPFAVLTAAGALGGPDLELGTAIVPSWPRHPVTTATEALTVQALTPGPLTLGIGPSQRWFMTEQLGIPYTAPVAHTREYLEVLRPLLRGEHVRHTGRSFTVDTELAFTATEPSVLLSALGPKMLEVARDLADGTVAVWVRPDLVADHLVPALGDGARVAVVVSVAVTTDPGHAREQVAREFAPVRDMPAYRAVLDRGGLEGAEDTLVAGTEDEVAAELRRFAEAGATDLILNPRGTPEEQARALAVALTLR